MSENDGENALSPSLSLFSSRMKEKGEISPWRDERENKRLSLVSDSPPKKGTSRHNYIYLFVALVDRACAGRAQIKSPLISR